jgi:hypothetical protein
LVVGPGATAKPENQGPDLTESWQISAECHNGAVRRIVRGYPESWLRALTRDLAEHCRLATETGHVDPAIPSPLQIWEGVIQDSFPELPEPPRRCSVRVEHFPDGISILVPAKGVWRAYPGYLMLGVFASAIVAGGTAWLISALQPIQRNTTLLILVMPTLLLIGCLSHVVRAISLGRLRAAFAVTGGQFCYEQRGVFEVRRQEYTVSHIADVRSGQIYRPMEKTYNHALHVKLADGSTFEMLNGRDWKELWWIATVLRKALGMPCVDANTPSPTT